jgi:hypothetical protein
VGGYVLLEQKIMFHLLSRLAGFGHSGMIGIGFPTLRKKESYQGSGGPASWTLVKQRWLVSLCCMYVHIIGAGPG